MDCYLGNISWSLMLPVWAEGPMCAIFFYTAPFISERIFSGTNVTLLAGICTIILIGYPAPCQNTSTVYQPRKPTDSPLYLLLLTHFDDFEQVYVERFARDYGFYLPVISDVVRAYLEWKDLITRIRKSSLPRLPL